MVRLAWGIVAAALLAAVPATTTPAQNLADPPAKAAVKLAKPAVKTAAKKPETQASKKLVAAKPKAPVKKLAAAKKPTEKKLTDTKKPETKKLAVAKKPAEPAKIAEATKPAPAAETAPKPTEAAYTITSTHDGVTTTSTRIVPLSAVAAMSLAAAAAPAPAEPAEKPAVIMPVSLTQPATQAKPAEAKPVEIAAIEPKAASDAVKPAAETAPAAAPSDAVAAPDGTKADEPKAGEPKAGVAFVAKFLTEAFHIAKQNGASSLQRRATLADLFARNMDVKRIAGYTTAEKLTGASADIQQRFRTILVSYLVETYYPQLELASDPTVRVETAAAAPLKDGTAVVWTTFTKDGWGSQSVQWHLRPEQGGYKIVDIFSAGASLVQMERDTFVSVMRDGGLNELMAKLDQRTKELATAATE